MTSLLPRRDVQAAIESLETRACSSTCPPKGIHRDGVLGDLPISEIVRRIRWDCKSRFHKALEPVCLSNLVSCPEWESDLGTIEQNRQGCLALWCWGVLQPIRPWSVAGPRCDEGGASCARLGPSRHDRFISDGCGNGRLHKPAEPARWLPLLAFINL